MPTHARDMTRSGWKRIFEGLSELSRFFSEEEREPEHQEAEDAWERKGRAASVAFTTKDGRLLLVRRGKDEDNWPDTWSLPGGHVEEGEDFPAAAQRECNEELGDCGLSFDGIRELDRVRTAHDFEHVTYAVPVKDAFDPKLNDEHYDFCWAPVTKLPEPIHPGVKATIDGIILDGIKPYISKVGNRWELLDKDGNVVATASSMEELQPRLKQLLGRDSTVDPDRRVIGRNQTYKYPEYDRLAHDEMPLDVAGALAEDREPARTVDESGHMHVKDSVLTKAVVSPYKGSEINGVMQDEPGWVPLDPDKTYQLLRDPKELEKALSSFNGLPLLWVHKAATAEDHPTELVIGSTGTNAKFNGTDLTNDLSIWPQYATKAIEDGEKKNLSMGYGYKAVMEPGDHNGHNYDGRMINIKGNHCALVTAPRVPGSKVAGDAMPNEIWENIAAAISGMAA